MSTAVLQTKKIFKPYLYNNFNGKRLFYVFSKINYLKIKNETIIYINTFYFFLCLIITKNILVINITNCKFMLNDLNNYEN